MISADTCGRTAWQGYLTKEQEAKLREMRDAFPQSVAFHTDHDMLRFLRAREFNTKATHAMYQHYLSVVRRLLPATTASVLNLMPSQSILQASCSP